MRELLKLKSGDGEEVSVITSLAPDWKQIGVFMDFDENGQHLDVIAADQTLRTPVDRCQKMFQHWLNGNGRDPFSWSTVIEILRDAKKGNEADKLVNILSAK